MDIKRTKQLAGVTEQTLFRDAGEMLRSVLYDLHELQDHYQEDFDPADLVGVDVVADDLQRIIAKYEKAEARTRR